MVKNKTADAQQKNNNNIEHENYVEFPLVKLNFKLMGIAAAMIVCGFLLMLGSPSGIDEFNPDIYSARRIVVGPLIAFLGFLFMAFGIIYRPKKK